MALRRTAMVLGLTSAWLVLTAPVYASTNDILLGLDEKIVYGADGRAVSAGGPNTRTPCW